MQFDHIQYEEIFINHGNGIDLSDFNNSNILNWCILAGSDYGKVIQGVGIKKAYNLISKNLNTQLYLTDDFWDKISSKDYKINKDIYHNAFLGFTTQCVSDNFSN